MGRGRGSWKSLIHQSVSRTCGMFVEHLIHDCRNPVYISFKCSLKRSQKKGTWPLGAPKMSFWLCCKFETGCRPAHVRVVSGVSFFFLSQVAFPLFIHVFILCIMTGLGLTKRPHPILGPCFSQSLCLAFVQLCTCPTRSRLAGRLFIPAQNSCPSSHPHPGVTTFFPPNQG